MEQELLKTVSDKDELVKSEKEREILQGHCVDIEFKRKWTEKLFRETLEDQRGVIKSLQQELAAKSKEVDDYKKSGNGLQQNVEKYVTRCVELSKESMGLKRERAEDSQKIETLSAQLEALLGGKDDNFRNTLQDKCTELQKVNSNLEDALTERDTTANENVRLECELAIAKGEKDDLEEQLHMKEKELDSVESMLINSEKDCNELKRTFVAMKERATKVGQEVTDTEGERDLEAIIHRHTLDLQYSFNVAQNEIGTLKERVAAAENDAVSNGEQLATERKANTELERRAVDQERSAAAMEKLALQQAKAAKTQIELANNQINSSRDQLRAAQQEVTRVTEAFTLEQGRATQAVQSIIPLQRQVSKAEKEAEKATKQAKDAKKEADRAFRDVATAQQVAADARKEADKKRKENVDLQKKLDDTRKGAASLKEEMKKARQGESRAKKKANDARIDAEAAFKTDVTAAQRETEKAKKEAEDTRQKALAEKKNAQNALKTAEAAFKKDVTAAQQEAVDARNAAEEARKEAAAMKGRAEAAEAAKEEAVMVSKAADNTNDNLVDFTTNETIAHLKEQLAEALHELNTTRIKNSHAAPQEPLTRRTRRLRSASDSLHGDADPRKNDRIIELEAKNAELASTRGAPYSPQIYPSELQLIQSLKAHRAEAEEEAMRYQKNIHGLQQMIRKKEEEAKKMRAALAASTAQIAETEALQRKVEALDAEVNRTLGRVAELARQLEGARARLTAFGDI